VREPHLWLPDCGFEDTVVVAVVYEAWENLPGCVMASTYDSNEPLARCKVELRVVLFLVLVLNSHLCSRRA
jgi:hypothetical protein